MGAIRFLAKALLPLSLVVETFIVIVQLKERWSEFTVHYALHRNEVKRRKEFDGRNYKLLYMTATLFSMFVPHQWLA